MGDVKKGLVAVFVLGGLILFAVGLFMVGDRKKLFSGSINVVAEWKELGGLQNGATVRVSGMTGGEVVNIDLPPAPDRKFRVKLRVLEDFLPILRTDSIATIQTDGVVGNKLVEISGGTAKGGQIEDGGMLQSTEPFEFSDLLTEASNVLLDVRKVVDESKDQFQNVLDSAASVAQKTDDLVTELTPDLKQTVASGRKAADEVQVITSRVQRGEGTVGKLFRDDQLYNNAKDVTADIRQTTANVQEMVAEVQKRDIIGDVKGTTAEVKNLAKRANEALQEFQPNKGEGSSLVQEARQTLSFANEAMSDLSENSEALKHNFLFRGFFRRRGFYDLDSISVNDYRSGLKAPGYPVKRVWAPAHELFTKEDDQEVLTQEGRRRIAEAMAELLPGAKTNPVVVEGYAAGANRTEAFVRSQERAQIVREYLMKNFLLKPNFVGIMQMGEVKPQDGGRPWEGVSLVLFQSEPPPPDAPAPTTSTKVENTSAGSGR